MRGKDESFKEHCSIEHFKFHHKTYTHVHINHIFMLVILEITRRIMVRFPCKSRNTTYRTQKNFIANLKVYTIF